MGAQASSGLVLAVVPHATEHHQEEELFQMLAGAAGVLSEAGCQLSGGHSSEGAEPAFGELSHGAPKHSCPGVRALQALA